MRLAGKVAIITGAGAGIGRQSAMLFAQQGARVVVAERDEAAGNATLRALADAGHEALFVPTDVTNETAMQSLVDDAVKRFGKLDILFNNVGGSSPNDGPVTTAAIDEFWTRIKVDLFSVWLGCRFAIPRMIENGGGAVVNVASVNALIGVAGSDAYTAAKGGVVSLTRSMAVQFAPDNVRVNAVAPGATMTERVIQRLKEKNKEKPRLIGELGLIEPGDIANAVLFLASDDARRITGRIIPVDSGLILS